MFTKDKFLSLTIRRQHKHAGLYLRSLYEKRVPLDLHYRAMESWLHLPPLKESTENLIDRFQYHMQEAALSLSEDRLLVKQLDTLTATPFGTVTTYLENLRSAYNIGNILRTIEALRLGPLIFSENMPTASHPKVQKTAMGTENIVPSKQGDLNTLPRPLIALETVKNAPSLYEFTFPPSFTLLIGNEEYGLKEETLQIADHIVQIPLFGSKNSLNVANAFAITAHFIKNQLRND
jgi:tRNA G18 (ribose-2'-O)-methylase SpoU